MRKLTEFEDVDLAQGFINQLAKKDIEAQLHENDEKTSIWILDDENLPKAMKELSLFQANPQKGLPPKKTTNEDRNRHIDVRTEVWGASKEPQKQLTILLILISVCTYLGQQGGLSPEIVAKLYIANPIYVTPLFSDILGGELWRLVTPIFLHFGTFHILFNMLWLYQLGINIETIEGPKKLFLVILGAGVLSNMLQYYISGPNFGGMSGVVYGLLSYAWGMGRWKPSSGYFIDKGTFGFMMVWLILCFTGIVGSVANFAHLGGFLVGLGWAKYQSLAKK